MTIPGMLEQAVPTKTSAESFEGSVEPGRRVNGTEKNDEIDRRIHQNIDNALAKGETPTYPAIGEDPYLYIKEF